jgi:hypothetical protein
MAPRAGVRRVAGRTSSASWAGTFNKPEHPEVHAMTLIRRASKISAGSPAARQPERELVGAGSGR